VPDQPSTLFAIPKPAPGAISIDCLRCDAKGRTSCFGVLWLKEWTEEDLNPRRDPHIRVHQLPRPSWHLAIRLRHHPTHNTEKGPRPKISAKRESFFVAGVPHGVTDVRCPRCKRRVTLSAKALGRRANGRTSILV
jgi:hypothetical protein